MKIYLLTEGGSEIGMGHITRCLSICQAFEEKDIHPVFIINSDCSLELLLKTRHLEKFDWLQKKERLFELVKDADIVLVDSYLADISFYKQISETVKIPVYIDDTIRLEYPRGIVLNGTIFAEELGYHKRGDVKYLLGSRYIPLRKEFWDVSAKEIKQNIQIVMITFGGDDLMDMTPKALMLLKENYPDIQKKVVIGRGFKNTAQVESHKDTKTELIYFPDAEGMKQVMLESDIAISAAGQTLYELARVGVPTIAIAVADNQKNNVKGWQKAGFIAYAGKCGDNNLGSNIVSQMNAFMNYNLRYEKSSVGRQYIDGLGALRTVTAIMDHMK